MAKPEELLVEILQILAVRAQGLSRDIGTILAVMTEVADKKKSGQ